MGAGPAPGWASPRCGSGRPSSAGRAWSGRRPAAARGSARGSRCPMGEPTEPVRVLIADDQAITRGGLRALLEAVPGLKIVGEAADGAQAIALAERLQPDVVLMDLR